VEKIPAQAANKGVRTILSECYKNDFVVYRQSRQYQGGRWRTQMVLTADPARINPDPVIVGLYLVRDRRSLVVVKANSRRLPLLPKLDFCVNDTYESCIIPASLRRVIAVTWTNIRDPKVRRVFRLFVIDVLSFCCGRVGVVAVVTIVFFAMMIDI
jgi:hypothetical protein